MEWWQGFWGWAATTFLALVAAAGVIIAELRAARNRPFVRWNVNSYGWISKPDGRRLEVIEMTNLGTATAALLDPVVRDGQLVKDNDFPIPVAVLPGSSFKFLVDTADLSKSHILMLWHRATDRHVTLEWFPFDVTNALSDEKMAQLVRSRRSRIRPLYWLQDSKKHIGPGGAAKRSIRSKDPKVQHRIRTAMGLREETEVQPK